MTRPGRCQRAARSRGQASPPTISTRSVSMSPSIMERSVGTQESTVTPSSVMSRAMSGPARMTCLVAGSSTAPWKKAIQISSSEASKAGEAHWKTRSSGPMP